MPCHVPRRLPSRPLCAPTSSALPLHDAGGQSHDAGALGVRLDVVVAAGK